MPNKSLTLRLPIDIYQRLLERRTKSVSSYVVEAVKEKLDRDKEAEQAAGFASLKFEEDDDVSLWQGAQKGATKHAGN